MALLDEFKAKNSDFNQVELDRLVDVCFSREAEQVNDDGYEAQIEFLVHEKVIPEKTHIYSDNDLEELNDMIHDRFSHIATEVNNAGLTAEL